MVLPFTRAGLKNFKLIPCRNCFRLFGGGECFNIGAVFSLRNCSKANFVKTLTLLYSEKVGVIGTCFSTLPGDFEQGLQANCTEKIDENG